MSAGSVAVAQPETHQARGGAWIKVATPLKVMAGGRTNYEQGTDPGAAGSFPGCSFVGGGKAGETESPVSPASQPDGSAA